MTLLDEFRETDPPREVVVDSSDLRAIRRIRVGLTVEERGGGRVRLGPQPGWVGTAVLPSGRRIVVQPKAAILSFADLLALAYRTQAPPVAAATTTVEEATPTEWLLLQLAAEVERLIAMGVRRSYVDRRELLPFVRGRLRPPLNPARLPAADCEFSDFVLDTPENRLLRGTLELIAPAAANRYVRRRLSEALSYFREVALVQPTVRAFDRVRTHRLNAHYAPSLQLARLALEGAGVEDAAGTLTAPGYFVPMWRVWEMAVAQAVREAAPARMHEQPEFVDRVVQVAGTPRLRVTLRPDLVLGGRTRPKHVVDMKWRPALALHQGRKRLRNDHLSQLIAYCVALECDGTLLYPVIDDRLDSTYRLRGRTLYLRSVDLSQPELVDLRAAAQEVVARAQSRVPVSLP